MSASKSKRRRTARAGRGAISAARLAEMIDQAIVDAHGEGEQATGLFTMLEEHLDPPFQTDVLGVHVTVEAIDLREDDRIVAVCRRGKAKQVIAIVDLALPTPKPGGAEWIEAYRHWLGGHLSTTWRFRGSTSTAS
jgi:hypothetical protein